MRSLFFLFILAALCPLLSGCRADPASQRSSQMDSQTDSHTDSQTDSQTDSRMDRRAYPASPDDNSPAEVAPRPSPASAHDTRPVIVCFGDSLTAGYGADPGASYPDFLQRDLDSAGFHYRVVNAGISGNTTKDGVERLPAVLALHPTLVIVEFGGNDGLRGLPISSSRDNLDKMIASLKAGGARVALAGITLPPDYGPDYIQQFNQTYTLLASKYHVPLLPFLLQNVYGVAGLMQRDQTHATSTGNQVVARNVLTLIQPLLKKQPAPAS